jgi:predicted PurR-regulated permease PerM
MRAEAFRWFVRGGGFALGAALAVAALYTIVLGARVVVLMFIALLLASGLEPIVAQVRSHSSLRRGVTLLLVYVGLLVLVAGVALLVVPAAIGQLNQLSTRVTPLLNDARTWTRSLEPRALAISMTGLVNTVGAALTPSPADAPGPDQLIAIGLTFADAVISVVAVFSLTYFWLTERAHLQRFALAFLPLDRRAGARDAWNQIEERLGAWVRGELILMGSVGIATSVAYFVIGLDSPLLLGLLAALAEAIPLVGPALGAVPALVVAGFTGNIETVVLVAVVYIVIQVIEGNVLIPLVMHNTIGIPPFVVIVSILAGAAIAGIPGALIAVPLAAAMLVVLERLQARSAPVPIGPGGTPAEPVEDGGEASIG